MTLDADVKEKLCEDEVAIRTLVDLAKEGQADCQYGIITLFVNLTNSYEKEEIMPEMLELAKFILVFIYFSHFFFCLSSTFIAVIGIIVCPPFFLVM